MAANDGWEDVSSSGASEASEGDGWEDVGFFGKATGLAEALVEMPIKAVGGAIGGGLRGLTDLATGGDMTSAAAAHAETSHKLTDWSLFKSTPK